MLPPNYTKDIELGIMKIRRKVGVSITAVFTEILQNEEMKLVRSADLISDLDKSLQKAETLVRFQTDESKYHPLVGLKKQTFLAAQNQLHTLRLIHYHLENLLDTPLHTISWTSEEKNHLLESIYLLNNCLNQEDNFDEEQHENQMNKLAEIFWEDNEQITKNNHEHPTNFPPELIIMYELLSIYSLIKRFYLKEDHAV
jgi:hypothetical protein